MEGTTELEAVETHAHEFLLAYTSVEGWGTEGGQMGGLMLRCHDVSPGHQSPPFSSVMLDLWPLPAGSGEDPVRWPTCLGQDPTASM